MTNDDFTEAAWVASENFARTPRMNVGTVRDRIAEAHLHGWEAARDYLTERCTACGEDPSGPLRPLSTDERSYRYAQDLGYELPEEPPMTTITACSICHEPILRGQTMIDDHHAGCQPDAPLLRHCDLPCCNPEEDQ